jgi:NAD(P)-dependent dehydrogenase (short-subunit alcohol dehydrogenase family)
MGLLEGKVAIITGAAGGLGRAYAELFCREGASVLLNDLGVARDGTPADSGAAEAAAADLRKQGFIAVSNASDVSRRAGADELMQSAITAFGRVDILINNAGIIDDKSFLKLEEAAWQRLVDVHLTGTFLCSQAFFRIVVRQGEGGRVVNTTSAAGLLGNYGQANYAAAKAGVYGLTRTMSIEGQRHSIRVNALAPMAKTRMTEDLPMFHRVDTMTPGHVAPAALYLASSLSGDRTGHVLAVAGARMYAFKLVETAGRFKESADGVWTAQEIAESWDSIVKG